MTLAEDEREALMTALVTDGCWEREDCCLASFAAMVPELERIIAAREARAKYFAMWHYFLTLPGPSPYSDMVQREAARLAALCEPNPRESG